MAVHDPYAVFQKQVERDRKRRLADAWANLPRDPRSDEPDVEPVATNGRAWRA